jgi:hypothetical protein
MQIEIKGDYNVTKEFACKVTGATDLYLEQRDDGIFTLGKTKWSRTNAGMREWIEIARFNKDELSRLQYLIHRIKEWESH